MNREEHVFRPRGDSLAHPARHQLKRALASLSRGRARGVTILIYHRVGGRSADELDCPVENFVSQAAMLAEECEVVSLDDALDGLARGNNDPKVVLTFDDGFADLYEIAWPILVAHSLPFTVYLATSFLGGRMRWEGSTSTSPPASALTWEQTGALAADPRCTIGNHTHTHVPPERLSPAELDDCTAEIRKRLGVVPRHFAYPWGRPVTAMEAELRARFRSVTTAELGRNGAGTDFSRLRRVPVRGSDPIEYFRAKVSGSLVPEYAYTALVTAAKAAGWRG